MRYLRKSLDHFQENLLSSRHQNMGEKHHWRCWNQQSRLCNGTMTLEMGMMMLVLWLDVIMCWWVRHLWYCWWTGMNGLIYPHCCLHYRVSTQIFWPVCLIANLEFRLPTPHNPESMRALLEHSQCHFVPLPFELHPHQLVTGHWADCSHIFVSARCLVKWHHYVNWVLIKQQLEILENILQNHSLEFLYAILVLISTGEVRSKNNLMNLVLLMW